MAAGLVLLAGSALTLVSFLQPWESCPDIDDSSAGCPASTATATLTMVGVGLTFAGTVLVGLQAGRSTRGGSAERSTTH